jgi:predicted nucleic acid-binding protein
VKEFVDTNVFVYAYDPSDQRKQQRARELIRRIESSGIGVISLQVLQEFFWTATRKLHIEPMTSKTILQSWGRFETVIPSQRTVYEAIDCMMIARLSFWDSLIIAAAEAARCAVVYSEDMNDQQTVRGVKIVNPFV